MQDLATTTQAAVQIANVERITASWPDLLTSPIKSQTEYDQIKANIIALSQPAPRGWIMARIASFLAGYYVADVGEGMVTMMAEDWAEAMNDYPQWAITKAVRWWKSEENPQRRQRPVEGDIQARIRVEMGILEVGKMACRRFRDGVTPFKADVNRVPVSAERAAEIMAEIGFQPKRFTAEAAE